MTGSKSIGAWQIEAIVLAMGGGYVGTAKVFRKDSPTESPLRLRNGPHLSRAAALNSIMRQAQQAILRNILMEASGCTRFLL